MKKYILPILAAIPLSNASAATLFTESPTENLSPSATMPTSLGTLALGDNDVIGQIGGGVRDHFTFNVADGQQLDAITLVSGTGANHFFGLDDQATFGEDLVISTLFSANESDFNVDFLDTFAAGGNFGGSGVTNSSLSSGDYTILVNETGGADNAFDYQLRLTTVAVPEPSSSLLLSLGMFGLMINRRRK